MEKSRDSLAKQRAKGYVSISALRSRPDGWKQIEGAAGGGPAETVPFTAARHGCRCQARRRTVFSRFCAPKAKPRAQEEGGAARELT